jgi:hypothetical protein
MKVEPSLDELRALARHADQRLALYRRRVYLGRGEPRRLAELERIAEGAAQRLRRAQDETSPARRPPPR